MKASFQAIPRLKLSSSFMSGALFSNASPSKLFFEPLMRSLSALGGRYWSFTASCDLEQEPKFLQKLTLETEFDHKEVKEFQASAYLVKPF